MHIFIHHIPWRRAALATLHFALLGTGTVLIGTGRALYFCSSHLKVCAANIKAATSDIDLPAAPEHSRRGDSVHHERETGNVCAAQDGGT